MINVIKIWYDKCNKNKSNKVDNSNKKMWFAIKYNKKYE